MADFRYANQDLLAKVEAVSGTEEAPTVGADAIKVARLQPSPRFDVTDTSEEHTGSLDAGDPIAGGGSFELGFDVFMRGAGVAGVAPEWGTLLRGCAMAQTLTAAPVADTAQAGGANTITLHAGASAVTDAYKGMVIETTGGTGSGQEAVIIASNGTTKVATVHKAWAVNPDATTTFSIRANALYIPASASLETLTMFAYQHATPAAGNSRLRKLIGAAGTFQAEIPVNQSGRMSFAFQGILPALPTDVADPGAPTFDSVVTEVLNSADAVLGTTAVKFSRFTLDYGASPTQPMDPAATYGLDVAGQTARRITGTISPYLTDLATRNAMSDFLGQTARAIVLRWGSAAGRRISILIPAARYTGAGPQDLEGYAGEEIPFQATGPDSGLYICVH